MSTNTKTNGRNGRRGLPREIADAIVADYARLQSCAKVAKLHGRSRQSIFEILHTRGVKLKEGRRAKGPVIEWEGLRWTPDKDGYFRCTANRLRKPGKVNKLHQAMWIKAHGPIARGMVVCFRDFDRSNVTLENLMCVTRSAHRKLVGEAGLNGNRWSKFYAVDGAIRTALSKAIVDGDAAEVQRLRGLFPEPPVMSEEHRQRRREGSRRMWALRSPEVRAAIAARVRASRLKTEAKRLEALLA